MGTLNLQGTIGEKVKELLGYYCSVNVCLCLLGGMLFIK